MRIIFAGTPDFAATALAALYAAGHEIVMVLTQPDRPAGRGMQLQMSAVKNFALEHELPVSQPFSLKLDGKYPEQASQAQSLLGSIPHDVMVVAAYGLILPQWVLDMPRLGCLNIHASLLPRWRGAAPIHRAVEAGDPVTGITIMQMDQGLDTGAMLTAEALPILETDTTRSLHDKLAQLGGTMIVDALQQIESGALTPQAQPMDGVCYAAKISKDETALDFDLPAAVLQRKIRALNPAPGAHALLDGHVIKIWAAEVAERPDGLANGASQIGQHELIVACAEKGLRLLEVQRAGGKRMPITEFLRGGGKKS